MNRIGKLGLAALALIGASFALIETADAHGFGARGGWYGPARHGPVWYGPRTHFSVGFGPAWTGGRWVHGWHGPRFGWWWTVGSAWYLYPTPVYPYPAYLPPVDDYAYGYGPGVDYGQSYAQAPDRNPQPPKYWYYCENPAGYYPYVHDCADWQQELAQGDVPPGNYPEYDEPQPEQ